jgi:hypothetical protein
MGTSDSLIVIPGLGRGEMAVVESLLQAAGITYFSLPGDDEWTFQRIVIKASDLPEVKEVLADFRIRTTKGELVPIPW